MSDTQIGLRFNVLERKGARPGIGFQCRLLLPAQSEQYKRNLYLGKQSVDEGRGYYFSRGLSWKLVKR